MPVDQCQDPSLSARPDGATMLKEYENAVRRMLALAAGTEPELPIPACPAWNARGIVSHVVGTAAWITSGEPLADDVQGWIDDEVRSRSNRSWRELGNEWDAVLPVLREKLGGQAGGGMVIDAVTHEQDLRAAIGPAVTDHTPGLSALLPSIIEHVRQLEPFGGGPGARLLTPTSDIAIGGPQIGVEAELPDDWELSRLLGCRRSAAQLEALPHRGDTALLYTLVSRYPLPEAPLDL
jgi:uncharacterized protein (TIGR03083 family)